jgi:hypothetical protein
MPNPNGRHRANSWGDPTQPDTQWQRENTPSDTTRYLCAAVYLKPDLARQIRADIIDENHRALGPGGGIDTGAVLRHAIAATAFQSLRAFGLVIAIFLGVIGITQISPLLVLIAILVGWLVVGLYLFGIRHRIIIRKLQRSRFRAAEAPHPGSTDLQQRLDSIAQHVDGNVTIYSAYSPFVGEGDIFNNWSVVVDLSKVKDPALTMPFSVAELHKAVADDVRALNLPGLRVTDRLFVGGDAIRDDPRFLPDPSLRPNTTVEQGVIDSCAAIPENSCRHYTHIQITGWRGELVVGIFLRLVLLDRSLFVETNYTVLTPLPQECYEIDAIPPVVTIGGLLRLAGEAAVQLPGAALHAIPDLARLCWQPISAWRHDAAEERLIRSDLAFDYGAKTTIRESAADGNYRRYFQRIDREMNTKLVDRRIFEQIISYLEDHNIETGEVQQMRQFINYGIYGNVTAGAVAVGSNPTARTTN